MGRRFFDSPWMPQAFADRRQRSYSMTSLEHCSTRAASGSCLKTRIPFFAYNFLSDFELNAAQPWLPTMTRDTGSGGWDVLGHDVTSPFGVAASVLTVNSRWVEFFARSSCDVTTYKTVRTRKTEPSAFPHWRFLRNASHSFPVGAFPKEFTTDDSNWPSQNGEFSTANSFGVPSDDPIVWQPDFQAAKKAMDPDQLLILSVMGTSPEHPGDRRIEEDFALAAEYGVQADATVIELNLSCPNTVDRDGSVRTDLICKSPSATRAVVDAVRDRLGDPATQLIIKMSWMPKDQLAAVIRPLLRDRVIQGVSGINTMQVAVRQSSGEEAFPGRLPAGVSGTAIREHARFCSKLQCTKK